MPNGRRPGGRHPFKRLLPVSTSATTVHVDEVDPGPAPSRQGGDDGAEGRRGAAATPDDLAQVVGVHAHLQDRAATQLLVPHDHVVGVFDDTTHQVLERLGEHGGQDSVFSASASTTSAASAAGVSSAGVSAAGASSAGVSSAAGASSAAAGASSAAAGASSAAAGASSAGFSSAFFFGA